LTPDGKREGRHIFADDLKRFADTTRDSRLIPIIRRVTEPIRVAVRGRCGAGRGTVAAALAGAGVTVVAADADVDVLVIAETLKPEDRAALSAADHPVLTVLNKADLLGMGAGGPLATAERRAADCQAMTGVPTVPMVGLLARALLDDELVSALRTLTVEPADLTSTDAFLDGDHRVPREVRARLLATLDRFGIAHSVLAMSRGAEVSALPALLRQLSGVVRAVAALDVVAAPVRYRRVRAAIAELEALAVQSGDSRIAEFLAADDTVIAVMAAAVAVVEGTGLVVDPEDQPRTRGANLDPRAHLRRAVHWRRYSRGPVNTLHRSCGADISRGSLRLLGRTR
jgi:hypothetical protein